MAATAVFRGALPGMRLADHGPDTEPDLTMNLASNVAVSRLVAAQRAMDITADNLANVDTPGYKSEHVLFTDWLSRQGSSLGSASAGASEASVAYVQDRATWRDQANGPLTHTGNPFDLALTGDGYFTVATPNGPRLTRNGRFGLMPDGTLSDMAGNAVLDTTGQPIKLSPTDTSVTIASDGTVSSAQNGQLGKIGVVQPSDLMRVTAEGSSLFRADVPTAPVTAPGIVQGAVEDSNVQPVLEVTRMMDGLRQFQFVSEMVQAENDRQQSAIDKLLPQGT
jgi:flagellar basal-body rod protein FlgF